MLNGKINRKEALAFINDKENAKTAKEAFGGLQPQLNATGWYSAASWNWSYMFGIVKKDGKYYQVATQFGSVVAACETYVVEY